jgi:hypothetical protein
VKLKWVDPAPVVGTNGDADPSLNALHAYVRVSFVPTGSVAVEPRSIAAPSVPVPGTPVSETVGSALATRASRSTATDPLSLSVTVSETV